MLADKGDLTSNGCFVGAGSSIMGDLFQVIGLMFSDPGRLLCSACGKGGKALGPRGCLAEVSFWGDGGLGGIGGRQSLSASRCGSASTLSLHGMRGEAKAFLLLGVVSGAAGGSVAVSFNGFRGIRG